MARRKTLRDEEGVCGELDRASPGVMDLHTSSPSSPGPRAAQRPFVVGFPPSLSRAASTTSSLVKFKIAQECPFPGPSSSGTVPLAEQRDLRVTSDAPKEHSHIHGQINIVTDLPPFQGSSSESCPFPGPQTEMCPLSESSYQNRLGLQTACFSAVEHNHLTDVTLTSEHVSHDLCTTKQTMTPFCDNSRQDQQPVLAQSPVCPTTGFPSPDGAMGDFPESTCPRTGFPGPGYYGSISFAAPREIARAATAHSSGLNNLTMTRAVTETETLFKNSSTYHNFTECSNLSADVTSDFAVSALQSNGSDSSQDLFPKKEQTRSRPGFSLSSMLSSFRWKSRPPTLSLGSPIGAVKDGSRHVKKHTVESSGVGDGRVQLTPVSEAVENCDLTIPDVAANGVNRRASWQATCIENMEQSESDFVRNICEPGSNFSNATTIAMASTQNNLSFALASSAPTLSQSDSVFVTSASDPSCVTCSVVKPTRLNISAKKFTLPLSSPTSSFPVSSLLLLPSPGDSNKRKSFPPSSSDSPDKLAKTETSHHHSLSPPRTLNLGQGSVGRVKLRSSSRRPFVLPISSPTAATAEDLARLKVTSPSEPVSEKTMQGEQTAAEDDHKNRRASCSDIEIGTKINLGVDTREPLQKMFFRSSDPHSVSEAGVHYGYTKWKSATSLTVTETTHFGGAVTTERVISSQQHTDTSLFSSMVGSSSSSVSAMPLSSSSSLSKSCTSIYSPSAASSTISIHRSISSSRSVNLQGFSQFPTTSLDKLSFTPCYTKDIVQELKKQESEQLVTPEQGTSPSEGNLGPSVLDSPMSISSGSSAPSIASSTISPVESTLTNPFSDGTFHTHANDHNPSAFPFTQSQITLSSDGNVVPSFGSLPVGSPSSALSPSGTSDFILSPSSLPQSTVAPTTPTLNSPFYCGSLSMESLSPMSLSDSSSSSPSRSPTRNGITSPLPSSISSPASSVSSPVVSSPPFSPLIPSPVSSSSHMAGTVASIASSITTKVVLRRDKNRRVMDRPNSIAFSSYPTCDLVPAASGDSGGPGHESQDDSSEIYRSSKSKRSRRSNHPESHVPHGRTSWGGYSEREMYRQITAAMENAMLRTQVFSSSSSAKGRLTTAQVSSRKARSLDDILDSNIDEDEFLPSQAGGALWSRRAELNTFEKYRCGMQNVSEPYHSNSSISSGGSHNGSVEIQVS